MPARPVVATLVVVTALTTALVTAGCTGGPAGSDAPEPSSSAVATPEVAPSPTETLLPSPTATGSAVGGLAPGFPADLVAPPEGSEILVSSAEPDATTGLTTISLNLRSPLATADLLQRLRDQLVAAGFVETVGDAGASGLAATSTFVRGDGGEELLTLGVLDRGGVRTLTLGGTVRL